MDFATPANSTFTTFATPAAAGFTALCPTTRSCVPELGVTSANKLDGIGDRLMFRLAYRNFGDHESVVGNFTVSSGGVAGIRWFELRDVTAGPVTVFQESTYQPDTTWRWMGSAAMDWPGQPCDRFQRLQFHDQSADSLCGPARDRSGQHPGPG